VLVLVLVLFVVAVVAAFWAVALVPWVVFRVVCWCTERPDRVASRAWVKGVMLLPAPVVRVVITLLPTFPGTDDELVDVAQAIAAPPSC